jgi:hypothetical protein
MVYVISWRRSSRVQSLAQEYLFHPGFMLGLFFDPEDGGDIFLPNVG